MRVGIDATSWANRRGYGRFTRGLLRALLTADSKHSFTLFIDAQTWSRDQLPVAQWSVLPTRVAPTESASHTTRRSLRDLWSMALAVSRQSLDALVYPTVYTYFPAWTRASMVVGFHDTIPEEFPEMVFPDRRGRRLWNLKCGLARRQADYILTVSEHSKRSIVRYFGVQPERVWVVGEAPAPVFGPLAAKEIDRPLASRFGLAAGDRFLIYLGGVNPHKNLETLMESLAELGRRPRFADVRLVVVGEIEKERFTPGLAAVRERIASLDLQEKVVFTGFLDDPSVAQLLNAAYALVLPSFAEGYGLPAVEAAACGTPVIATRNSPLPEILAGGGLFIDPSCREQLTSALVELLADSGRRQGLARTARRRAHDLTWKRSAQQMLDLLAAIDQERRQGDR